ncbi:MAG: tetratricopeptide repeat protein [Muribaculaceae bacterium]
MNKYIRYIIACLFISIALPIFASKDKESHSDWTPSQRKAEYLFLEGLRMKSQDKNDAFYELLKRAHEIDPHNTTISYYLGYCILMMNTKEKEITDLALSLMKGHVDESPHDYYENNFYATINNQLGNAKEAIRVWDRLSKLYPNKTELLHQLANGYSKSKTPEKALSILNKIEERDGKSIEISVQKINYYLDSKDTVKALSSGMELLKTAPKNIQYNLLLGDLYLQLGMRDSALSWYDTAQKIEPNNGLVNLSKASFYNAIGDSINYDNQIYKALANEELGVESKLSVLTDYMRQLIQEKDSSARIDNLFKVLISQHPHEMQIHQLYSKYLMARVDYKGAAEQLSYVLDIDPTSAEDWKKLMIIYLLSNDFEKAINAAQKSLTYNPDNIELYQYIAPAYYQMKEYDKALQIYTEAIEKVDSTDVELRSNLYGGMGDVYFSQGDSIKAFQTYEKALSINPSNISILNNYAFFLAESGKELDKAEKMSALTVKGMPNNPTFLDTYAWIYFKKGEYKLAKIYIESAISYNKEPNADISEHYGDILFMNGAPAEALKQWEQALKLKPESELLIKKVKNKTYFYK